MDINLESLYETVDQLTPQQRAKLMDYLVSGYHVDTTEAQPDSEWQFDLARGAIQTTPDFDDPLPDDFWLGNA
jgi:hypothetical protein